MKEKKETICAIIVTYNRRNLLLECLEAIIKQTQPVDAIYLIDNASTDGTPEFLKEKGYISELPPTNLTQPWEKEFEIKNYVDGATIKLYYVHMHENTGSAGGFHEGVKRAYEKGYDWFWLMDDDVEPFHNALEIQISFSNISKCIHPTKVDPENKVIYWGGYIDSETGSTKFFNDIYFKRNNLEYIVVNKGCFEGMLINREIVNRIGFPDKRFFICGDDTIYGFLASIYTKNIYINKICFKKKIKPIIKNFIFFKKQRYTESTLYYFLRNSFLTRIYLKKYGRLVNWKWWFTILKISLISILGCIIYDFSFRKAFIVLKAMYDGYRMFKIE